MKTGYMLFRAEAPMVGLAHHSACAPSGKISSYSAAGWAEAYDVHATRALALAEAAEDHAARKAAVAAGDLEDTDPPDLALKVRVDHEGNLTLLDGENDETVTYTREQVYGAFGMDAPSNLGALKGQRDGVMDAFWKALQQQTKALGTAMANHDISRLSVTYELTDGIAGLQEFTFVSAEGKTVKPEDRPAPAPPYFATVCMDGVWSLKTIETHEDVGLEGAAEIVMENLAEYILTTSERGVDAIHMELTCEGEIKASIEGVVTTAWLPSDSSEDPAPAGP